MTSLLLIHIFVAAITMAASVSGLIMAWRLSDRLSAAIVALWLSFAATAVTGIALVVISPQALAHTCVMMSAYVVVVTAVHMYARRRVAVSVER